MKRSFEILGTVTAWLPFGIMGLIVVSLALRILPGLLSGCQKGPADPRRAISLRAMIMGGSVRGGAEWGP